jgi:hypothetical protein
LFIIFPYILIDSVYLLPMQCVRARKHDDGLTVGNITPGGNEKKTSQNQRPPINGGRG